MLRFGTSLQVGWTTAHVAVLTKYGEAGGASEKCSRDPRCGHFSRVGIGITGLVHCREVDPKRERRPRHDRRVERMSEIGFAKKTPFVGEYLSGS